MKAVRGRPGDVYDIDTSQISQRKWICDSVRSTRKKKNTGGEVFCDVDEEKRERVPQDQILGSSTPYKIRGQGEKVQSVNDCHNKIIRTQILR